MGGMSDADRDRVEAVRRVYAALNRGDAAGMVAEFDPGGALIEAVGVPSAGVYRGREEVEARVRSARATWAEGACEPEEFHSAGDKVVAFVHVHVRLEGQPEWVEARLADVFTFRDGRVVETRTFLDRAEGLEWAGVDGGQGAP